MYLVSTAHMVMTEDTDNGAGLSALAQLKTEFRAHFSLAAPVE